MDNGKLIQNHAAVQEVATDNTPKDGHDKLMSNTQVQSILIRTEKEAQD
jgi:hypothetical protein